MIYRKYSCLNCNEKFEDEYVQEECPYCKSDNIRWEGNYRPYD